MIKKYNLDPIITKKFIENNLSNLNELSRLVLQIIDQIEGKFFTFLSEKLTEDQVHDFSTGGKAKNMRKETSRILYDFLTSKKAICIFDDINTLPKELDQDFIEENDVFICKNEIYYLVEDQASMELIFKYLNYSSAIWHSLCVVSKQSNKFRIKKEQNAKTLESFSKNAILILLEAYDGEGYVFWERC